MSVLNGQVHLGNIAKEKLQWQTTLCLLTTIQLGFDAQRMKLEILARISLLRAAM